MNKSRKTFHDFTLNDINGDPVSMSRYKGKKILAVNVASRCGYTPQYIGLQKLYEKYKDDLVVLGFPANNFGKQEPGSDEDIKAFCELNYGVTFPLFSKISVKGDNMHPLYKWLSTPEENGWNDQVPTWNFCKYLIDENGNLLKFFSSAVKPMDEDITSNL